MLTTLDLTAIVAYALALFVIGYFCGRKESAEGFLISDRKMGLISSISTINATKTGAIILVYTALLYDYGLSALWYFIGVVAGYFVFVPFAMKLHRKSNGKYYTLAHYFSDNYGAVSGYAAASACIIIMIGFLITNLIAASKVFSYFTGISFAASAISVAIVILIYLIMAGFKAVVKTDILQYIAIFFLLTVFLIPLSQGIDIPAQDWNSFGVGIPNILSFVTVGIFVPFASPDLWQRIYAMPDQKRVKNAIIASILIFIPACLILTLVGLFVKAYLPHIDADIALIHGFATLLPSGMVGLALVIFFAAFMSSIDTYTYTASSSIVQDLIRPSNKERAVKLIRIVVTLVLIFCTIIAIVLSDLLKATYIFAGFLIAIAIPSIATAIRPSIKPRTVALSLILGILTIIFVVIVDVLRDNLEPILMLKGIIGSVLGLVIGYVITLIERKRN